MTKVAPVDGLSGWLTHSPRVSSPYSKFALTDIVELATTTQVTKGRLATMLQEARMEMEILNLCDRLGWKILKAQLSSGVQPKEITAQRGEFGEVLTNAILREFFGYTIPVEKLRSAITSDQSLPSTDTIGLKRGGSGLTEVCFVESKFRTSKSKNAAMQGYGQLRHDYSKSIPDMGIFILKSLFEKKDPFFDDFFSYLNDRTRTTSEIESFHLGLTWEKEQWSEDTLQRLEDEVSNDMPRLAVHLVRLSQLASLVDELFHKIGVDKVVENEND